MSNDTLRHVDPIATHLEKANPSSEWQKVKRKIAQIQWSTYTQGVHSVRMTMASNNTILMGKYIFEFSSANVGAQHRRNSFNIVVVIFHEIIFFLFFFSLCLFALVLA